jgi:hypothetical protein
VLVSHIYIRTSSQTCSPPQTRNLKILDTIPDSDSVCSLPYQPRKCYGASFVCDISEDIILKNPIEQSFTLLSPILLRYQVFGLVSFSLCSIIHMLIYISTPQVFTNPCKMGGDWRTSHDDCGIAR